MKELLSKIEAEMESGATTFEELSDSLQEEITENIFPEIVARGLDNILNFLQSF